MWISRVNKAVNIDKAEAVDYGLVASYRASSRDEYFYIRFIYSSHSVCFTYAYEEEALFKGTIERITGGVYSG